VIPTESRSPTSSAVTVATRAAPTTPAG
jgi:hypothetical protein